MAQSTAGIGQNSAHAWAYRFPGLWKLCLLWYVESNENHKAAFSFCTPSAGRSYAWELKLELYETRFMLKIEGHEVSMET
jgi:hypothetical protein